MEGKFWLLPILVLFLAACPPRRNAGQPSGAQPGTSTVPQEMCRNLTPQEKSFAAQLSSIHQNIFCNQFSSIQRAEAMAMVTPGLKPNAPGAVTPDEAVEKILQGARGQTAPPPPPSTTPPSLNIMK